MPTCCRATTSSPMPLRRGDGNGRDSNAQDQGDWYAAGECGQTAAANSSWHGTHVAGTVAAVTGNSTGVAGVAPNAKIVPVRVLAKCGGSLSDIADAIIWASGGTVSGIPANANPAKVINMSLGGSGTCGTTYQAAINSAVSPRHHGGGGGRQQQPGRLRLPPGQLQLRRHRCGQQPERQPVLLLQLRRDRGPHRPGRRHQRQPAAASSPRSTPEPPRRAPPATPATRAPRWPPRTSPASRP